MLPNIYKIKCKILYKIEVYKKKFFLLIIVTVIFGSFSVNILFLFEFFIEIKPFNIEY